MPDANAGRRKHVIRPLFDGVRDGGWWPDLCRNPGAYARTLDCRGRGRADRARDPKGCESDAAERSRLEPDATVRLLVSGLISVGARGA